MGIDNGRCDRCNKETNCIIMSIFNTQEICMDCKDRETKNPHYKEAQKAEMEAIRQGNRNFKGIGL